MGEIEMEEEEEGGERTIVVCAGFGSVLVED